VYLGVYDSEIEAAQAYDRAAKEYFGDSANLNLPDMMSSNVGPIVPPSVKKQRNEINKSSMALSISIPRKVCPPKMTTSGPRKPRTPPPGPTVEPQMDSLMLEAQLFDPADHVLLELERAAAVMMAYDIGPMTPIPSLVEGEWHEACFK